MANHCSVQLLAPERLFHSRIPIGDGSGLLSPSQLWERVKESEVCLEFFLVFLEGGRIYLIIPEQVPGSELVPDNVRKERCPLELFHCGYLLGSTWFSCSFAKSFHNCSFKYSTCPKGFLGNGSSLDSLGLH